MFSLFQREPKRPPSKNQIALCKRLGLQIKSEMSSEDVSHLIEVSLKDEKYKARYEEYTKEKGAEAERQERETYGDEIINEMKKWERLCNPGEQYLAIFKKGKNITTDVIEFEQVTIEGDNKYSLKIEVLLPKLHKDKDTGDCLEWESELSLKPQQILHYEPLKAPIDIFDIASYHAEKVKGKLIAEKYLA